MSLAIAVAVLAGVGAWLVVRGGAVRLILGFILLGHAANLVIIAAGGTWRRAAPFIDGDLVLGATADPLPQAFVLTAIVITFGVTVYLLSLVARTAKQAAKVEGEAADPVRDEGKPSP
jgi:multicomponent Na+:H+ antiporter subunit C